MNIRLSALRRPSALVAILLLTAFVAGCNDEPAQRKAFITFLQTRIIDKPGLHVPHLTQEEAASFGDYAKQYAIITDFNDRLDKSIAQPMTEAINRGAIRSIDDVVTRHADFIAARDGINKLHDAIDKQLTTADSAHAALKQPDDLKTVYDKAYERDVTIPAKAFADIFPDLSEALTSIVDLGDFIERHKDKVSIVGNQLQTTDPALRPQLQAMIDALMAKSDAISKAQEHLRLVMNGG
ncbi:MAG TPA: DUF3053 domain-containing protein [Stellaceae bacterium]|nr:DUF3053 domain-containing protein [Stellaceae bacterium]